MKRFLESIWYAKGMVWGKNEEGMLIVENVGYEERSRYYRSHTSHFISLGDHFGISVP
jgi:hypothetical protein